MADAAEKVPEKVISLVEKLPPAVIKTEIIDMLERWLAQAKEGAFSGVAIVAAGHGDTTFSEWMGISYGRLAGSLARAQYRVQKDWDECPNVGVEEDEGE